MKALVVYESLYGNTARIAEAIGQGLNEGGVETVIDQVDDVDPAAAAGVDLLVVGGPTHARGLGLRAWTEKLPAGGGRLAAAFDTRMHGPKALTGSAAKGITQRLQQHGFQPIGEPGSFLVTKQSTLEEGEAERARAWGHETAVRAAVPSNG